MSETSSQPISWLGSSNSGSSGTTLLLYFAFALVHDSHGIEIVKFTISLALSAGTLMASAGTPYRLVPAHFYPCGSVLKKKQNPTKLTNNIKAK